MGAHDDRRVGHVAVEDRRQRLSDGSEHVVVEWRLRERGSVARSEQQGVPLAERHVQPLGEVEHHLPARPRPAGL